MSLEALEQALFEAKWGNAEGDAIELLSRMFEVEPAAVERILYAASKLRRVNRFQPLVETMDTGPNLPQGLRDAIDENVDQAFRRMVARCAIQNDDWLFVRPLHLIPDDHAHICAGCLVSMECAVNGYSEPEKCFKKGPPEKVERPRMFRDPSGQEVEGTTFTLMRYPKGAAKVKPVKLAGDTLTVTCEHPKGTYSVNVMDIVL